MKPTDTFQSQLLDICSSETFVREFIGPVVEMLRERVISHGRPLIFIFVAICKYVALKYGRPPSYIDHRWLYKAAVKISSIGFNKYNEAYGIGGRTIGAVIDAIDGIYEPLSIDVCVFDSATFTTVLSEHWVQKFYDYIQYLNNKNKNIVVPRGTAAFSDSAILDKKENRHKIVVSRR